MDTSKLKPFDLEKAKDGALFCHKNTDESQAKYFCDNVLGIIGTDSQGRVFLELRGGHTTYKMSDLRMLPEVKKFKALLVRNKYDVIQVWEDTPASRHFIEASERMKILKEFEVEYDEE